MSRVDELIDKLKTVSTRLTNSVQESESYSKMQDRYQSLSSGGQKALVAAASLFFLSLILFYPLSKISQSQILITTFEEKRALIRDLFKTYREASGQTSVPVPPQYESLKASIDSILNGANLIPEQRVGIIDVGTVEGRLIPQSLVTHVLEIKLAKLNLKQIVDIGTSIAGISESVKMKDLVIAAHPKDTRYFDVSYKLYSLNVPEAAPEQPPEIEIKPKKGSTTTPPAKGSGRSTKNPNEDAE